MDKQRLDAYPMNLTLKGTSQRSHIHASCNRLLTPRELSVGLRPADFTYFLLVPSLVYEPAFPRRDRIRYTTHFDVIRTQSMLMRRTNITHRAHSQLDVRC